MIRQILLELMLDTMNGDSIMSPYYHKTAEGYWKLHEVDYEEMGKFMLENNVLKPIEKPTDFKSFIAYTAVGHKMACSNCSKNILARWQEDGIFYVLYKDEIEEHELATLFAIPKELYMPMVSSLN